MRCSNSVNFFHHRLIINEFCPNKLLVQEENIANLLVSKYQYSTVIFWMFARTNVFLHPVVCTCGCVVKTRNNENIVICRYTTE